MTSRVLPSWPYNRHGMIVRNAKGMTFVIKGDGHLGETPEARRVIALAVLESRNQISERRATGTATNPMDVWDYTPSEDGSVFYRGQRRDDSCQPALRQRVLVESPQGRLREFAAAGAAFQYATEVSEPLRREGDRPRRSRSRRQ